MLRHIGNNAATGCVTRPAPDDKSETVRTHWYGFFACNTYQKDRIDKLLSKRIGFYKETDFDEDALFKRYRSLKFDCDIGGQTLFSGVISVIISLAVLDADLKFIFSDIIWVNNLLSFVCFLLCLCFLAGSILLFARFFLHGCMSKDALFIKPTELKSIDEKLELR